MNMTNMTKFACHIIYIVDNYMYKIYAYISNLG